MGLVRTPKTMGFGTSDLGLEAHPVLHVSFGVLTVIVILRDARTKSILSPVKCFDIFFSRVNPRAQIYDATEG